VVCEAIRFSSEYKLFSPMPYSTNEDLPPPVARHLPPHAQDIYREAFNHAWAAHAGDPRQEEAARRIAWAAVKRSYVKIGNSWVARL
jgi:cation transport regulator